MVSLPLLVFAALLDAARVSAASEVTCHKFTPADRATWNFDAYTPNRRLSASSDCRNSSVPCSVSTGSAPERITWAPVFSPNENIRAHLQANVKGVVGEPYADRVSTAEVITLHVPPGQVGYLATFTRAVEVPGWFEECGNERRYEGRALVPSARDVTYRVILHN